ncbi:MAG: ThuA domain-containing protein [Candidatus Hodarchaeota archaeon]
MSNKKNKILLYLGGRYSSFKTLYKRFKEILPNYLIDMYENTDIFSGKDFFSYDTTIFFSQMGELTEAQEKNILDFVRIKGFIGLHGASASFKEHPKYFEMLGGRFISHKGIQTFDIKILDRNHQIIKGLDDFSFKDEPYRHDFSMGNDIHVLAEADYHDPDDPKPEPIMWIKNYGKGRVFFCSLGHGVLSLKKEIFRTIIQRAVEWVLEGQK